MLHIRSFLNSDIGDLADLWCMHHAAYRPAPSVSHAMFEQAIASRLFFDPTHLWIAKERDVTLAWCQWFEIDSATAAIYGLCFRPEESALPAAAELLVQVQQHLAAKGVQELQIGVDHQRGLGYQGLDPVGHGLGVDMADDRSNTLLESAGFIQAQRIDRWEIQTANFRAPVSRDFMNLRRSTRMEMTTADNATNQDDISAMIHLETDRYRLIDTVVRQPLAHIDVWTSDPTALVMPCGEAILGDWSHSRHRDQAPVGAGDIAVRYLVSVMIPRARLSRGSQPAALCTYRSSQ